MGEPELFFLLGERALANLLGEPRQHRHEVQRFVDQGVHLIHALLECRVANTGHGHQLFDACLHLEHLHRQGSADHILVAHFRSVLLDELTFSQAIIMASALVMP